MWDVTLLMLGVVGIVLTVMLTTLSLYVLYSGFLTKISIRTSSPPISSITVAYKYRQGPYKECGGLFTESCTLAPKLSTVGIFYDDPKKVPGALCRCAVGSILSEGDDQPSAELQELFESSGFRIFTFPEVSHAVSTSFPHRTTLSIFLGVRRVYPQLTGYIKERKLCAHPFLEIYRGSLIHYMSPLARQGDFYVPEVQEALKRPQEGEESDEDGKSDITGADCSECSSVSRLMRSDSRDSSPAPSVTSTLLYQDRDWRDKEWREKDWPDRESPASELESGRSHRSSTPSSFEELDLEADRTAPENSYTPLTSKEDNSSPQERVMLLERDE